MSLRVITKYVISSIYFEIILFFLITASIFSAVLSLLFTINYLETINFIFCTIFCIELSIRLVIAEDKTRHFKDFWADWIASVPWDYVVILLFSGFSLPLVWMKFFRFVRLTRMIRIISILRSNTVKRFSYLFKKQLEKSLPNQFLSLAIVSLVSVAVFATGFYLLNRSRPFSESLYFSLITLISSDSIFEVYNKPLSIKLLTLILAFLGIVLFNGVLIAVVVTRLTDYLNSIRAGKGLVMEKGHLLVLGDHPLVPFLVEELGLYCKTENKKISIVLLREEMNEEIRTTLSSSNEIDLIIRCGTSYNPHHLEMISLNYACSAIVLGNPLHSKYQNDSTVIKSFLTIRQIQQSSTTFLPKVFFSVNDKIKNRYMNECSQSLAYNFDLHFFSAKILVATLINPHKLSVFKELFGFRGCEFHFSSAEKLTGFPFYRIYDNFKYGIPIGIERCGTLDVLPSHEEIIRSGDRLIIIAESEQHVEKSIKALLSPADSSIDRSEIYTSTSGSAIQFKRKDTPKVNAAIVGINDKLPHIVEELLKIDSSITVIDNQSEESFVNVYRTETGVPPPASVHYQECNFRKLHEIQSITRLKECNSVLILADQDNVTTDFELIDADTIYKVLKMRQLKKRNEISENLSIVAETISQYSEKALHSIPDVTFIMTPQILGQLVGMFMIEPHLRSLIGSLVQKGGNGIDIEIFEYTESVAKPFFQISREYIISGIACIGFVRNCETKLNPDRETIIKPGDLLIVLLKGE